MTSSILTKPPTTLRTVLPNGLTVIAVENPAADIVSARLFINAGHARETPETAGLLTLMMAVLTKGTNQRSALEIAEAVESIGASFGADVAADYSLVSLKTVSTDFETVLTLAAEVMCSPSFPEREIELERRLIMQGLKSLHEQPFGVAYNSLREALFAGHPYGLTNAATEACIPKFTREDLVQAHQTYFRPDACVVSVVGRIAAKDAIAQVEQAFGDWHAPEHPLPTLSFPNIEGTSQKIVTVKETNQAFVLLGYLAGAVDHPDYAALKLISTYLGNGLSSRLFVELREKQGLAYDVSAFFPTRKGVAQFVAYIGTAPENAPVALEGLQKEVEQLKTEPLSKEDLAISKNKILGQYALGKQTSGQIAQLLGWYETIGLGLAFDQAFQDAITAVTVEDIQAAAQRCFTQPVISILGPAAAVSNLAPGGVEHRLAVSD